MTPAPADQLVLITGASGFVAAHIVRAFLAAGYNVRATVRSEGTISKVKEVHSGFASQLSFAIVPDIAAPHAFDEAVKGVSGVVHTASPFVMSPKDVAAELLEPAIRGTTGILEAAAKHGGSELTKVVITASFASQLDILKGDRPGYVYTEKDWNPATYEEAAASDNGAFSYCASKALAEKAAWDWVDEHKPSFQVTAMDPPWVFGPSLSTITSLDHLNESTDAIWKLVNGSTKEIPPYDFLGFVYATDIANAHLLAYESEKSGGERFIVGSHFDYQTAMDYINEAFPDLKAAGRTPIGTPGAGLNSNVYVVDGSKAEKVLGLKYTSLKDAMIATVNGLIEAEKRLGWVASK